MRILAAKFRPPVNTRGRRRAGFTLLEFMVAMMMFLVLGATVISMFAQNAPLFTQQQNTASLNIELQSVVGQLQLDLSNAGTGFYPGMKLPTWPTGLTIINQNPTTACNNASNYSYSSTCFDKLNVLALNSSTPPTRPTNSSGSTAPSACSNVSAQSPANTPAQDTASTFYIQPATGLTVAQTAAGYSQGDQVLLVQFIAGTGSVNGSTSGGSTTVGTNAALINTFVLTGTPTQGANYVGLPFKMSGDGTTNPYGVNTSADDPLDITTSNTATNLGTTFCATDWVMKLDPITYWVDASNIQDPTLKRNHVVSGTLNSDTLAEQIIGFKVGASVWGGIDNGITTSTATYNYLAQSTTTATPAGYNSNFALVRSVRISLIGRTLPNIANPFRNTFDGGPYQVLGTDVAINPRNITMN
jgi:prepilin-type N-terminal cleavage/methylation domain-containing protein